MSQSGLLSAHSAEPKGKPPSVMESRDRHHLLPPGLDLVPLSGLDPMPLSVS